MTKKFLAMLLAVVMVVSMLPNVFAAAAVCPGEGEIHSKDNCTNYKKADEEPVAPGCCTPGYTLYVCEDCGEHFASDIIVATEADDCTFKKVSEYVAPDCLNAGAWAKWECEKNSTTVKYTDAEGVTVDPASQAAQKAIAALGHDYGDMVDCHAGKVCKREGCGEVIEAGKHSWETKYEYEAIVIDQEPTETVDGKFHFECTNDGCDVASKQYIIVACGHNKVFVREKSATCTENGVKAHWECTICKNLYLNETDTVPTTADKLVITAGHTFITDETDPDYAANTTVIDPTCKTTGFTMHKCTVCNEWITDTETIVQPSTEYCDWDEIKAAVPGDCENTGYTAVEECTVCHSLRGNQAVAGTGKGHSKNTTKTVTATCVKGGISFTYCTNSCCSITKQTVTLGNDNLGEFRVVGAITYTQPDTDNHTLGWVVTQEPTCKAFGHQVEMCTLCEAPETATGRYESLEPSVEYCDWEQKSLASCTEAEKWECKVCGNTEYADAKDALGHTSKLANGQESPILTKYPTCKADGTGEDGYTYQECQRCGVELNKTTISYNPTYIYTSETDATNQHDLPADAWNNKVVNKPGTCTVQGLWSLGKCQTCQGTVLVVIDGTGKGHTTADKDPNYVAPTCTDKGHYVCQNTWCELQGADIPVDELGHENWTKHDAADATCTENGSKEYYTCTRACCQKQDGTKFYPYEYEKVIVNEGTDNEEITYVKHDPNWAVINKLNHSTQSYSYNKNQCEDFAFESLVFCTRCGFAKMSGYEAAWDHEWTKELTFDSCTTDGYYICTNVSGDGVPCDAKKTEVGSAPGHKDEDGNVIVGGCLSTNKDVAKCDVCKQDMNYDHDLYVEIDDADATCTQPGYDLVVCKVCDFEQIVINENAPATNHMDGAAYVWKVTTPATHHKEGVETGTCSKCGDVKTRPIEKLTGISFQLDVDNAAKAGAEIVDSSIVAVKVTMDSLETGIWGYQFDVDYAEGVKYLGAVYHNAKFPIYIATDNVFTPSVNNPYPGGYVTIMANAENDAEGKLQNIPISGETEIITLYFKVMGADEIGFMIDDNYTQVVDKDKNTDITTSGDEELVEVGVFADCNNDNWVSIVDVQVIYEYASGAKDGYESCADYDKNGVINIDDVTYAYKLASGAMDDADIHDLDAWTRPEGFKAVTPVA